MSQPKVSIIVPVYKAEDTICKALDSIAAQTLTNFEVLLVDDGSPDNCGVICDEYAAKDLRFKTIHKKNSGVSAARQTGVDNAIGEYVIHVDPDDWVEPTMLEDLYAKANAENSDMVICDFFENVGVRQVLHKQQPSFLDNLTIMKELFGPLHGSCCNKLIKRSCYSNNIRFPENVYYCEDLYVIMSIVKNNAKVTYLPKAYYHYVQYDNKTTMVNYYGEDTYEHDLRLKELFLNLIKDECDLVPLVSVFFDRSMLSRAFKNGISYYSSASFKDTFSGCSYVLDGFHGTDKCLLSLSLHGYYHAAWKIYHFGMHVKHFIRSVTLF